MKLVRVLIAEDHSIVREGVRLILEAHEGFEVVGEATTGADAVRLAAELRPDVVCMDISMPGLDGLEATRMIRKQCPGVAVLALTVHDSDEYFFEMLKAGASGYVLKGSSGDELVEALRAVARGQAFLNPSVARKIVDDYFRRAAEVKARHDAGVLSPREREVVALVADGLSNKEIAERLVISISTVQTHYQHILEKLGLASRADVVKYAIRQGLSDLT